MNPQNGKGSAPRKGANDKKFKDNYDKIFGKKKEKPSEALDELAKQAQEWGLD